MGFWFANITSFIVELDLKDALKRRRNMQEIAKMKGHVIICGAGRTGRQVAQEIVSVPHDYVIIERDPTRIEQLAEYVPDARVLEGDATHDHVLLEAGLLQANGLITCLSADADNLHVCLSLRVSLGPGSRGATHNRGPRIRGRVDRQALPRRSRPSGEPQRQRRESHGVGGSQAVGGLVLRYRHSRVGAGAASAVAPSSSTRQPPPRLKPATTSSC